MHAIKRSGEEIVQVILPSDIWQSILLLCGSSIQTRCICKEWHRLGWQNTKPWMQHFLANEDHNPVSKWFPKLRPHLQQCVNSCTTWHKCWVYWCACNQLNNVRRVYYDLLSPTLDLTAIQHCFMVRRINDTRYVLLEFNDYSHLVVFNVVHIANPMHETKLLWAKLIKLPPRTHEFRHLYKNRLHELELDYNTTLERGCRQDAPDVGEIEEELKEKKLHLIVDSQGFDHLFNLLQHLGEHRCIQKHAMTALYQLNQYVLSTDIEQEWSTPEDDVR